MEYIIREIKKEEYDLLEDFLYEAVFLPEGVDPPSRDILKLPELKMYIEDFGKKGDEGLLAFEEGKAVGAVWTRRMKDYGYIDDDTPSLSISLYKRISGKRNRNCFDEGNVSAFKGERISGSLSVGAKGKLCE